MFGEEHPPLYKFEVCSFDSLTRGPPPLAPEVERPAKYKRGPEDEPCICPPVPTGASQRSLDKWQGPLTYRGQ